jgi:hypothetical protein
MTTQEIDDAREMVDRGRRSIWSRRMPRSDRFGM